jgi:hypothetical protein
MWNGGLAVNRQTALQKLWMDTCTVYESAPETDPITKLTDFREQPILAAQPCRLSFKTIAASAGDEVAAMSQAVKLFLAPDIVIKPGSRILVQREGRAYEYRQSGKSAVYSGHQEIMLTLSGEHA